MKEQVTQDVTIADPIKGSSGDVRILVAEDNKTNQLIVKSILKDAGVSLTFANDGLEAVQEFQKNRPDIVLMDMSMPRMDGIDATRTIRKLEDDQTAGHCRIVALTANALREDQDRCLEAGMDDFLTKPISKKALVGAIEKWRLRDMPEHST